MHYSHKAAELSRASQDRWELHQLIQLLSINPPTTIVEIGVDKGYSLEVWANAFKPGFICGIDNNPDALDTEIAARFQIIHADSHEQSTLRNLLDRLNKRAIDFLFIDGDHTKEAVLKDFQMYAPLVRSGGVIAFHDVMRVGPEWKNKVEVREVFDRAKMHYKNVEIWNAAIENAPGIGVLFV